MITKEISEHHVIHIKFYADKDLGMEQEMLDEITWEAEFDHVFEVERIVSHRFQPDELEFYLLIKWKNFSDLQNSWEPLRQINLTAPLIFNDYIRTLPPDQQELLLSATAADIEAANILRHRTTSKYRFQRGDIVLVRGSYWSKAGHIPEF